MHLKKAGIINAYLEKNGKLTGRLTTFPKFGEKNTDLHRNRAFVLLKPFSYIILTSSENVPAGRILCNNSQSRVFRIILSADSNNIEQMSAMLDYPNIRLPL